MRTSNSSSQSSFDCDAGRNVPLSRRDLLSRVGMGLGGIALADLVNPSRRAMAVGGVWLRHIMRRRRNE